MEGPITEERTPAVAEGCTAQARISAAAAKSEIVFSGRTRVAAGPSCMILERVCVAMELYIVSRARPAAHTAAAATSTSTQPRCAVTAVGVGTIRSV